MATLITTCPTCGNTHEFKSTDLACTASQPSYIVADHETEEGSGWEHDFGMGNVTVRFAYDLHTHDLVAVALLLAGRWTPATEAQRLDLEDSLQNANADALDDPAGWGLIHTDALPSWATLCNQRHMKGT